ncbi:MAG TPA: glycosyltransferase family 1 protein [Caldithrix abyssi]|uniref:Glycosyltransferase family 1 protein n=1 Tax=Caldithrix abyssi TaxID=187145 RepID=A0A7V4U112_CALAY|nr:glycosyltransferase family 1 protein [Caldithrix abyssi]
MKIFYLCPDVPFPSGGVYVIYKHVRFLREAGYEAYVLHFKKPFKPQWFAYDLPVLYLNDNPPLEPGDAIIIPEGFPEVMKKFASVPLRKIVFALSHSYIFDKLPPGENWNDYNVEAVLTPSPTIRHFVQMSMGIDFVSLIPPGLDATLFYPQKEKELQTVYMGRKDRLGETVHKIILSRRGSASDIPFIKMNDLPLKEYAALLRRSKVYLTASPLEGAHISVLEAMACGCVCVGFHGLGGRDYMVAEGRGQNFILVENMDYIALAEKLEEVLMALKNDPDHFAALSENARLTAATYTEESERRALLDFWRDFTKRG